ADSPRSCPTKTARALAAPALAVPGLAGPAPGGHGPGGQATGGRGPGPPGPAMEAPAEAGRMGSTRSPSCRWIRCLHRTLGAAARNERGIALLIVLIVVALLTITVTEFTYSVQIDQHRTRNAIHALQAQLLARSGINLAEGFLMLDDEPSYDARSEQWWLQL